MHREVTSVDETALTNAIVDVVAAERGTESTAVRTRIYDYLDTEALASLARRAETSSRVSWQISLEVEEVEVTITGGDGVAVTAE